MVVLNKKYRVETESKDCNHSCYFRGMKKCKMYDKMKVHNMCLITLV